MGRPGGAAGGGAAAPARLIRRWTRSGPMQVPCQTLCVRFIGRHATFDACWRLPAHSVYHPSPWHGPG